MIEASENDVKVLKLTLHGRLVGYLAGFLNGRNVLSFADEFRQNSARPTFSLIFPSTISSTGLSNQEFHGEQIVDANYLS